MDVFTYFILKENSDGCTGKIKEMEKDWVAI